MLVYSKIYPIWHLFKYKISHLRIYNLGGLKQSWILETQEEYLLYRYIECNINVQSSQTKRIF